MSKNDQAEKQLKGQLSSVEKQQSKTQETLKEKENELEKLRAQLKTAQGSFEVEMKKLNRQVTESQEVNAKKVSSILFTTAIMQSHIHTFTGLNDQLNVFFTGLLERESYNDILLLYMCICLSTCVFASSSPGRGGESAEGPGVGPRSGADL